MNNIDICGILVYARPGSVQVVTERLAAMPGVEVHGASPEGRMVVTIEERDGTPLTTDSIRSINEVAGVLSTALIYQHSEPADEEAA